MQSSDPMRLAIVEGLDVRDHRLDNYARRYNGAPSQDLLGSLNKRFVEQLGQVVRLQVLHVHTSC